MSPRPRYMVEAFDPWWHMWNAAVGWRAPVWRGDIIALIYPCDGPHR